MSAGRRTPWVGPSAALGTANDITTCLEWKFTTTSEHMEAGSRKPKASFGVATYFMFSSQSIDLLDIESHMLIQYVNEPCIYQCTYLYCEY